MTKERAFWVVLTTCLISQVLSDRGISLAALGTPKPRGPAVASASPSPPAGARAAVSFNATGGSHQVVSGMAFDGDATTFTWSSPGAIATHRPAFEFRKADQPVLTIMPSGGLQLYGHPIETTARGRAQVVAALREGQKP